MWAQGVREEGFQRAVCRDEGTLLLLALRKALRRSQAVVEDTGRELVERRPTWGST